MAKKGEKRINTKKVRNSRILAESATGKTAGEIAKEMNLDPKTVYKALKGDDAKKLLDALEARIQLMATKALDTLDWAMENKAEFGVTGSAVQTAIKILKSLGALKDTVDLNHNFPRPTIIRRQDGTKIILGTETEEEK